MLVVASRRVKWKVRGNDLISRLRKNMDRKIGTFICLSKRHLTYNNSQTYSTADYFLDLYGNCLNTANVDESFKQFPKEDETYSMRIFNLEKDNFAELKYALPDRYL